MKRIHPSVIPAKAGIHVCLCHPKMDPGFRRDDEVVRFAMIHRVEIG